MTDRYLAQDNFERAVVSAQQTLRRLDRGAMIDITKESVPRLRTIAWDLEAIGAAIRLELMNRETDSPVDLG
jgi:hypothetical protein